MFKKILDLFTWHEKKKLFFLLILILIMALLDALGVASILPFVAVLANPKLIETNAMLVYLYQESGIWGVTTTKQFLFVLGVGSLLLLTTSLFFRAITVYAQVRFGLMREYSIGKRLIEGYLHQPYIWFLNKNSADIGKNILSEVSQVIYLAVLPMVNLVAQSAIVLMLLILLILVDPVLAFSVSLVLTLSYGAVFYLVKNTLSRIGSERVEANEKRFTSISEAFGAIKELKVGGLEQAYINRFAKPAKTYANNNSLAQVISLLPRYFIEVIAFGGMIILVLTLISRGDVFTNIVPIIALYAFAGYRLMPALQQVYTSFTQIRFSNSGLDLLHKDLINLQSFEHEEKITHAMRVNKYIALNNVSFSYPNAKKVALKNISLSIPAFSKVGIVGATGSGKTTLVDLILGLLEANQGSLVVDGNLITASNKRSWQKSVGYIPQQIYLSDASVAANIAFGVNVKNVDMKAVEEAAKIANLHDFVINQLPQSYNTTLGERGIRLSGGQRQRIGIARALYHKPQVLFMDEATNALDSLTEQAVIESINSLKYKITIIIIAHRLSTIKNCDFIFLLEHGQLRAEGKYEQLSQFDEVFKKMLDAT